VYVEMRRRSSAAKRIQEMLDDMTTLTEYQGNNWEMTYEGQDMPFTVETFERLVPLSPLSYREQKQKGLNEWRVAAGIEPQQIYPRERDIKQLQSAAGI
jgi:hypothetical protein